MSRQIIFPRSLEDEHRDVLAEQREKDHRGIIPEGSSATTPQRTLEPAPDDYSSRLIKYVPAEVITLFVTLNSIITGTGSDHRLLLWGVFVFGVISTPLYLYRLGNVRSIWQMGVATGAFIVWVFALGGPFASTNWYEPIYGAVLLPAYTFLIPLISAPRTEI